MQTDSVLQIPAISEWADLIAWAPLIRILLRILLIIFLSWVSFRLLLLVLRRIERASSDADPSTVSAHEQRLATISGLIRSVGLVVIVVFAIFLILDAIGQNIAPLLAGAGVIGLAISFGAQSLVRDIISGLFILFENQFGVGDVIRIGDVSGSVERMTLRIVVLRDVHGTMHIVPNGEITRVSNLTRAFSRAVVDVSVGYREDVDRVIEVMRSVGVDLWKDPKWRPLITDEPVVPGIEAFGESSISLRMLATTLPLKQWDVARELRRRLKRRFDEEGIEIPFPQRTLLVDGQRPADIRPMNETPQ